MSHREEPGPEASFVAVKRVNSLGNGKKEIPNQARQSRSRPGNSGTSEREEPCSRKERARPTQHPVVLHQEQIKTTRQSNAHSRPARSANQNHRPTDVSLKRPAQNDTYARLDLAAQNRQSGLGGGRGCNQMFVVEGSGCF